MRFVAPDFQQEGMDWDDLRDFVEDGLSDFGAPKITILNRSTERDGDKATCLLNVLAEFPAFRDLPRAKSRSRWRVSLRKAGRVWYITEVTPLEVEGRPAGGLAGLRRSYRPGDFRF